MLFFGTFSLAAQSPELERPEKQKVRTMTIPITFYSKQEMKDQAPSEFLEAGTLVVTEDNDQQQILSIRSVTSTPLHVAILIQDDLTGGINNQLQDIAKFIRNLPDDSRVMIAYARAGSVQIAQKFTPDHEKAAKALRIVIGSPGAGPRSPYSALEEVLDRFDAVPTGRRAVLMISDGVDASDGLANIIPGQSVDLDRAILKAQRKAVPVYSFYNEGTLTRSGNSRIIMAGQGSLNKLSEETGGRAFYTGSISPISFEPFFRDLDVMFKRQFALTYLSTHMQKGFHAVKVASTNPTVGIEHPAGYYYRGN